MRQYCSLEDLKTILTSSLLISTKFRKGNKKVCIFYDYVSYDGSGSLSNILKLTARDQLTNNRIFGRKK